MIDFDRPRLQEFQAAISQGIPCEPEHVRSDLQALALPSLLIHYVNWQDRFIPSRPRHVGIWEGFWRHGIGKNHIVDVSKVERMIGQGDDLTPLLSDKIKKFGYVRPWTDDEGKHRGIEWRDKDYALNAHDVHHLHLSKPGKNGGRARRTKELLFVAFSRHEATIIMLGDHHSFDDGTLAHAIAEARAGAGDIIRGVTADSNMSWKERAILGRRGLNSVVAVGDKIVLGPMLSGAGTAMNHSMYASQLMRTIEAYEPLLDDDNTCRGWAADANRPYPDEPRFMWSLQFCDLGVIEKKTSTFYSILRWRR